MILVDLRSVEGNRSHNLRSLDRIINRIREIDEIGWYDSNHIGILLPYTNGEGAHKLVENLGDALGLKMPNSALIVYTYPSK